MMCFTITIFSILKGYFFRRLSITHLNNLHKNIITFMITKIFWFLYTVNSLFAKLNKFLLYENITLTE